MWNVILTVYYQVIYISLFWFGMSSKDNLQNKTGKLYISWKVQNIQNSYYEQSQCAEATVTPFNSFSWLLWLGLMQVLFFCIFVWVEWVNNCTHFVLFSFHLICMPYLSFPFLSFPFLASCYFPFFCFPSLCSSADLPKAYNADWLRARLCETVILLVILWVG